MKTFFTSDTHFYHANIIIYCNRPWLKAGDVIQDGDESYWSWVSQEIKQQRANEMTEAMISNWNNKITNDDDVYHLGDFIFGAKLNPEQIELFIKRLNFKNLYLIWGNHDEGMRRAQRRLEHAFVGRIHFLGDMKEVTINGQRITLCHYAMKVWEGSHHGTWHLYGHSHGSLADDPHSLSFDVGVDCTNYEPLTLEEVTERMSKKYYMPLDHHGKSEAGGGSGLDKEAHAKAERRRLYTQLQKEFNL
jgi:calcineurin-like phosphoesterase family protein